VSDRAGDTGPLSGQPTRSARSLDEEAVKHRSAVVRPDNRQASLQGRQRSGHIEVTGQRERRTSAAGCQPLAGGPTRRRKRKGRHRTAHRYVVVRRARCMHDCRPTVRPRANGGPVYRVWWHRATDGCRPVGRAPGVEDELRRCVPDVLEDAGSNSADRLNGSRLARERWQCRQP
jgi:hypothetical protein